MNLGQEERPRGHEGVQAPVVAHVGDDQGQEGRRRQGLREDELQQELGICTEPLNTQGCQMAKFDRFPSLDLRRGGGREGAIRGKEVIKFCGVV